MDNIQQHYICFHQYTRKNGNQPDQPILYLLQINKYNLSYCHYFYNLNKILNQLNQQQVLQQIFNQYGEFEKEYFKKNIQNNQQLLQQFFQIHFNDRNNNMKKQIDFIFELNEQQIQQVIQYINKNIESNNSLGQNVSDGNYYQQMSQIESCQKMFIQSLENINILLQCVSNNEDQLIKQQNIQLKIKNLKLIQQYKLLQQQFNQFNDLLNLELDINDQQFVQQIDELQQLIQNN